MPMTYPAHTFPQQPAKLLLSLRYLRSSRPFHLLFHNRPPSRSEGLRPDQPPPHHGVRRGVPGSLAVTQCGADLVVRPHQAFDALTAPSTRYRDERAVFCLLRLPRTTDATSSHRLAQHQHRPLLTGVQNCCYVMDLSLLLLVLCSPVRDEFDDDEMEAGRRLPHELTCQAPDLL
ncbi:uncharacterized protein [Triticum aestivum]|uniref:uncharacterized protein isoform X1 n=1 Tax=Triticum aestivum TaxID=4565 RepID=UPI001D022B7E|nr:uncharacterized protein LOC123149715 isoform X1 [Triticum aestivum]